MNRAVKEATIKAFHYPDLDALRAHILAFVTAYDFAKHLTAPRRRTPLQAICGAWAEDPAIFEINPHRLTPGPTTDLDGQNCGYLGPAGCKVAVSPQEEDGHRAFR